MKIYILLFIISLVLICLVARFGPWMELRDGNLLIYVVAAALIAGIIYAILKIVKHLD